MAYSKLDIPLSKEWVDLTTLDGYDDCANVSITVAAKYANPCYVFIGGTSAPEGDNGLLLFNGSGVSGTSDHWWIKGSGTISVLVED